MNLAPFPSFIWFFVLRVVLVLGLLPTAGRAMDVVLAWDPNPESDISGYIVRYGKVSGQYDNSIDAGAQTSATLRELPLGTYYCTVSAKNLAGLESLPSQELSFDITVAAPALVGITDGQSLNGPALINFRAENFGPDVTRLEFFVNNVRLGEISSSSESTNWLPSFAGEYTVTVKGYGAAGLIATSTLKIHIVQPTVKNLRRTEDQAFEMTVTGAAGRMQHVEVSEDLQTWIPFASAVNTTGAMIVRDDDAAQHSQRFYRVISE